MTSPSLDDLRDIHLPPPPLLANIPEWMLWSLAAGALMLALATIYWTWRILRHARLRRALNELSKLAASHARDQDSPALARGLSQMLRRYAQSRFPERDIGGLAGRDWLAFLDQQGGEGAFSNGVGEVLESLPYRPHGEVDQAALIALVRRWLEANPQ